MNDALKIAVEEVEEKSCIGGKLGHSSPVEDVKEWAKEPPNPLKDITNDALLAELCDRFPNLAIVGMSKDGAVRFYQGQWSFLYGEVGFLFDEIKAKRMMATVQPPVPKPPTIVTPR